MLNESSRHTHRRRRPTMRVLWVSVGVAAAMHGFLLLGADALIGVPDSMVVPPAMQVRALPAPAEAAESMQSSVMSSPARTQTVKPGQIDPNPPLADPPVMARAAHGSATANLPSTAPPPDEASRDTSDATVDAELVMTVAAAAGTADTPVPVYRTALPPAATLHYDLRKGFIFGSGHLVWKPAQDRYEARLEGSVAGMNLLTQTSTGGFDDNGLAPSRYTDARSRRGVSAANFQRDKGKITYSGPQVEYPLLPGSQDRVSWMVQIGAILNADPKLAAPDEKIAMFVSGANGDADVWVFRYVGDETLRTDSGPIRAVKFTREARKAYDRVVEVWLAPSRNHLPVRARFTANAGGDAFELLLRDIQFP